MIEFVYALIDVSDPVQKKADKKKKKFKQETKVSYKEIRSINQRGIVLNMDNNTFIHCITLCCCNSKVKFNSG